MDTDAPFQDESKCHQQEDADARPPQGSEDVDLESGSETEDNHITLIVQEQELPAHCIQDSEHPLQLKTKLASALSKVFGATKTVVDLDKL